jgi:ComF family protein
MNITVPKILGSLINVIFPADCPVCGQNAFSPVYGICDVCLEKLTSEKTPSVISTSNIAGISSCRAYSGAARKSIHALKYKGNTRILNIFKQIINGISPQDLPPVHRIDVIVPIPMHRTRLRKRGFNQSGMIASMLSEMFSKKAVENALSKTKSTPAQTSLNREERIINLKDSFAVRKSSSVKNRTVLLADDIMTTGATLEACAAELKKHGAPAVYAFTLARTMRD